MENLYEVMLLNKADLTDSDDKKIHSRINEIIEGKGKVISTVSLGKRSLAYNIKKQSEGRYWVLDVNLLPSEIMTFSQKLSRENDILRFLILRKEAKAESNSKQAEKESPKAEVKKITRKRNK